MKCPFFFIYYKEKNIVKFNKKKKKHKKAHKKT